MKRVTTALLTAHLFVLSAVSLHADNNWANWRGPNYDGSLEDASPPTQWSATQNIQWKVPVPGKGSGSPIVWGDQIFLLSAIDTGQQSEAATPRAQPTSDAGRRGGLSQSPPTTVYEFVLVSFNLSDGQERWRTVLTRAVPHEGGHGTNTFASSSAVTDGQHIYASFGSRGIYCVDMQGKLVWSKDLGKMQTRNEFGEGSSPALVKDALIVPWDHEGQSALVALDAATGQERWKTDRDERTTWATPLAIDYGNKTQIVTNGSIVRSYDLATGKLLWSCGGQVSNPIPCPVRIDDAVICMTGYRGNAIYALPLDAQGDITDSNKILWHNSDAAPYVSSPTLYKGQLYLTKERTGAMTSIDAKTGDVLIPPTRLSEIRDVYASPVAAGDKIYFTSRDGVTTVIRHGTKLEELAVNELGEPVDASPAIVGDRLIIRSAAHLYCIGN